MFKTADGQPAANAQTSAAVSSNRAAAPRKQAAQPGVKPTMPSWAGIGLLGYAAWKAINNNNNEPYQRAAVEAAKKPIDMMTYDTSLLRNNQ